MATDTARGRLLASSIFCGAALSALSLSTAAAQAPAAQTPATAAPTVIPNAGASGGGDVASGQVAAIVVTGSRIPQTNLTSVSPVQAVGGAEFQLQGRPNTIEVLNTLPQLNQIGNSTLSSTSNPLSTPGGIATADLRGLGPQRTLVLVNGRRLGIGDPSTANTNPSPDINQIPSQLIDRVEILTGGASATYGSDAVAGVVNFIMKQNFQGLQFDGQWGTAQHHNDNTLTPGLQRARNFDVPKKNVWDGQAWDGSLVFGLNSKDDRGNITGYVTYHKQLPVSYGRRDFAACQVNVTVTSTASTPACAGSSNSNIFYSADAAFPGSYAVVGNTFAPYSTSATTSPPSLFNANPYEYLLHNDVRYTAGLMARYEINRHANFYSEFSYLNDRTTTQVAPSGLFQGSGVTENAGFLVNCNNPFLSAQQQGVLGCTAGDIASGARRDLIIGRRNVEGGARRSLYDHENYRIVVGMKGDIAGPWKYDVYGQRYYTSLFQQNLGYQSLQRIQNGLLVTTVNGQPSCGPGCVPYNIFQAGGVTPAAVDYLNSSGSQRGSTTQSILSGTITGDLTEYGIKSPWATDGFGIALGGEYRKENLKFQPDEASRSGDLSGFGGASTQIDSDLSVKEFYAELRAPLAQNRPWADDLLFEAGYRYSDYSSDVTANTFKLGLQWAPVSDIRFRGSFQRAIRAPNIIELFLPASVTNTSDVSEDPCSGNATTPATATFAQCANTGVTAAQYGNGGSTNTIPQCPSGQCALLNAGNPNLRPERANTFSLGFTARPSFVPGLTASADFYSIKIKDQIGSIPLAVTLDNCLSTGNPLFCSQIRRASNGLLFGSSVTSAGYISGAVVNVGEVSTQGIDVQAAYNLPLRTFGLDDYGSISFSLNGSYLINTKTTPLPGEPTYDCAGLFGPTCDGIFPTWRHNLRATWNSPWNVQLSVAWRHLSSVKLETNTDDPSLSNGAFNSFNAKLPARDYIDLTGVWRVNDMLSFRAGVTNLFDKDPPLVSALIAGTGTPNTYGAYDLLGRRLFVGLTANF